MFDCVLIAHVNSSYFFHSFSKTSTRIICFYITYGLVLNSHDTFDEKSDEEHVFERENSVNVVSKEIKSRTCP